MRHLIASQLLCSDNNSPDAQVFRAVQNGLLDFCVASVNPDMSQIEQFIDGPRALDTATFAAAYCGKTALLNFFLEQVADINQAVRGAAQAGNESLVDDFIAKGSDKYIMAVFAVWEAAAADRGALVDHLLSVDHVNIKHAIEGAIWGNNRSLVDALIAKGADKNEAVGYAAFEGKSDLMDHLLSVHRANIDYAIKGAKYRNNKALSSFLEKQKPLQSDLKPSASTVSWGSMFGHRTSIVSQKPLSEETGHAATI